MHHFGIWNLQNIKKEEKTCFFGPCFKGSRDVLNTTFFFNYVIGKTDSCYKPADSLYQKSNM